MSGQDQAGFTPDQWQALILQALAIENEPRLAAEKQISRAMKRHTCMPPLLHLLFSSQNQSVRQMAAVLMRGQIVRHFRKFSSEQHTAWQAALLQHMLQEPFQLARHAAAELVAVIARIVVPLGTWPELFPFLMNCTQSANPAHKIAALLLFDSLLQHMKEPLHAHYATIHKVLVGALQDADPRVRVAALAPTGAFLLTLVEQEMGFFNELVQPMMNTIQLCLSQHTEDPAIEAFEVFDDLMEHRTFPEAGMLPFINFMLQIGGNREYSLNLREKAFYFIVYVARFKPKVILKNSLVGTILDVVFAMMCEPETAEEEENEQSAFRFGAQMIDYLCGYLPTKHVFRPVVERAGQFFSSQNPHQRKAGYVALGVMPKGCTDAMCEALPQLLPYVCNGMSDPDAQVRAAACVAMSEFSRDLQPDILQHHATVLPVLFKALDDPNESVKIRTLMALEAFVDELGDTVLPYLAPLMTKFVELLNAGSRPVQEILLLAIASVAGAAGSQFLPYFEGVQNMLKLLMTFTDEERMLLRCRATECVGVVAMAVGKQVFAPLIPEFLHLGMQGLTLKTDRQFELRELMNLLVANFAKLLGEDFVPLMPTCVPVVMASMMSTDGIDLREDQQSDDDEGEEGEGAEDDDEPSRVSVRTSFFEEKARACQALGAVAAATGPHFLPFLERAVKYLLALITYIHAGVREQASLALADMVVCLHRSVPGTAEIPNAPSPQTIQLIDAVIPKLLKNVREDESEDVVGSSLETAGLILKAVAPNGTQQHWQAIAASIMSVLKKETNAQHDTADNDEDDHGIGLLNQCLECMVELAKLMGSEMYPLFVAALPLLLDYANPVERSVSYRALVVGTIAEMAKSLGQKIAPHFSELLQLALTGIKDRSFVALTQNSIFCAGQLCAAVGPASVQAFDPVISALATVFDPSLNPKVLDNSCGALARLILIAPQACHLPQTLPVMLRTLPLKSDHEETTDVYTALCALLLADEPTILSNLPGALGALAESANSPQMTPLLQQQIAQCLSVVLTKHAAAAQQALASLTPERQQLLKKFTG